jgi:NAD(P)-dependent dehydrogenase (short-subunit alcohol dehydrogenase family)
VRILLIGAGTIGGAIAAALQGQHDVLQASRNGRIKVDIAEATSIQAMYATVGPLDAVVVAAGEAVFAPLQQLTDHDFELSLRSKLMGQVNVVRYGLDKVGDGGSFTLTSGVLAEQPAPGAAAISLVNAGLQGFVRSAALEMPRGIRLNVVSPGWISETLKAMGRDASKGISARDVAQAYVVAIDDQATGQVFNALPA